MNPTYDKMKNKLQQIQNEIDAYKAYMKRYISNGIDGNEWEYISMAKDLINEIEKIIIK